MTTSNILLSFLFVIVWLKFTSGRKEVQVRWNSKEARIKRVKKPSLVFEWVVRDSSQYGNVC